MALVRLATLSNDLGDRMNGQTFVKRVEDLDAELIHLMSQRMEAAIDLAFDEERQPDPSAAPMRAERARRRVLACAEVLGLESDVAELLAGALAQHVRRQATVVGPPEIRIVR